MQRRRGLSGIPNLGQLRPALLLATLLLAALAVRGEDTTRLDCDDRPTFLDPPWVDGDRFCAELVYQSPRNEALALASLAVASDGTLYAASPLRGEVWALRDSDDDRLPDRAQRLLSGLSQPTGMDWHDGALYILSRAGILRLPAGAPDARQVTADLPLQPGQAGGDLVVGADGTLYASLVAACSQCEPGDGPSILAISPDGSRQSVLARGLRRPAGLALRHGELWATDSIGRADAAQGDALDEINRIQADAHYGWPWCSGTVRLPTLPAATGCEKFLAPALSLPTGSTPLGLAHYDHDALPDLRDSLLVTLHGSRHRVELRGYALAVIRFDAQGQPLAPEVIIPQQPGGNSFSVSKMNYLGAGFWPERPLDLAISPEGWIYVSVTGGRILALRQAAH
ncbi:MAG: PQQ-dependent sugar dehydrogenase [Anaerolineaceae bacterium]|nr:PQQ-dependent sugar dehydrogenase [Anaerolineaceae bacterium]